MVEYWRRTDGRRLTLRKQRKRRRPIRNAKSSPGRKSTSFDAGKKRDPNPCCYSSSNAVTKRGPETVAKTFTQTQPQEKGLTKTERHHREKKSRAETTPAKKKKQRKNQRIRKTKPPLPDPKGIERKTATTGKGSLSGKTELLPIRPTQVAVRQHVARSLLSRMGAANHRGRQRSKAFGIGKNPNRKRWPHFRLQDCARRQGTSWSMTRSKPLEKSDAGGCASGRDSHWRALRCEHQFCIEFEVGRGQRPRLQQCNRATFTVRDLIERALPRRFVFSPSNDSCAVTKTVASEMIVGYFHHYFGIDRLPFAAPFSAPPTWTARERFR